MDPRYEREPWARLLAYVTGLINQELLLKNEYLAAENRVLRARLPARLRLSDPEKSTLAEIGKSLGRKALAQVACVAKPDTILAWYRKLIAKKFDGSKHRCYPGRPRIEPKLQAYSASGFLLANLFRREEEDVTFPLVVPFAVKMFNEVGECPSQ